MGAATVSARNHKALYISYMTALVSRALACWGIKPGQRHGGDLLLM